MIHGEFRESHDQLYGSPEAVKQSCSIVCVYGISKPNHTKHKNGWTVHNSSSVLYINYPQLKSPLRLITLTIDEIYFDRHYGPHVISPTNICISSFIIIPTTIYSQFKQFTDPFMSSLSALHCFIIPQKMIRQICQAIPHWVHGTRLIIMCCGYIVLILLSKAWHTWWWYDLLSIISCIPSRCKY